MANPKTICYRGEFLRKELEAAGAITPGDLCYRSASGKVNVHGTSAEAALKMFAMENDLVGDDIDTDYASGDTVQLCCPQTGGEVYGWLAYGENASLADPLVSAGDGTLAVMSTGEDGAVVAYAAEAKDNTTGGSDVRIKVDVA